MSERCEITKERGEYVVRQGGHTMDSFIDLRDAYKLADKLDGKSDTGGWASPLINPVTGVTSSPDSVAVQLTAAQVGMISLALSQRAEMVTPNRADEYLRLRTYLNLAFDGKR